MNREEYEIMCKINIELGTYLRVLLMVMSVGKPDCGL